MANISIVHYLYYKYKIKINSHNKCYLNLNLMCFSFIKVTWSMETNKLLTDEKDNFTIILLCLYIKKRVNYWPELGKQYNAKL